jgi:hypothetical protein
MLTFKASMFYLQCIILSETCYGKNAEAAENSHPLQLGAFQCSVTPSRVECGAHQAVAIKVGVYCVRAYNFNILACIVLAVALI